MGKNVIIFGANMHINGRNKNILVPCEGLTQNLEYAATTAESKFPIKIS